MGLLEGKVALITGGSRGQGRAHAVACAEQGADVILIDIPNKLNSVTYPLGTQADMDETVSQVEALDRRAIGIKGDVRSQRDLDGAVERGIAEFGKIDILIANAGIWTMTPIWELTEEEWDETIAVDLTGVWKSIKAVAPHMIERQSGSIVVTSSANGIEPGPNYAHYTSAKHGVIGLMRSAAVELGPFGIRANAILPGAINTPLTNHQSALDNFAGVEPGKGKWEDMEQAGYHFAALKGTTFMEPHVIADTAVYLNSELASKVTGVAIPVDGGHLLLMGYNHAPVKE